MLDTDAAKEIVDGLGADTFQKRTLELTTADGKQLAVPSDGWAQLLFYRKDLFKAAGLKEPTTYADIQAAAKDLNKGKTAGIVAATAPPDSFTQQTFEWVALANGCQLVDERQRHAEQPPVPGGVQLLRPDDEGQFGVRQPGCRHHAATYFAGDAAMVIWSSFLLDELAGLRKDALPTCDKCKSDPTWLAENSGIVTTLQGPGGTAPAAFGEVVSFAVLNDASPKTKELITYMMSDGYVDWLKIAPEGKVPTRLGTANNPTEYTDAWAKLEAGVDKKALLSDIYPADVLQGRRGKPGVLRSLGHSSGPRFIGRRRRRAIRGATSPGEDDQLRRHCRGSGRRGPEGRRAGQEGSWGLTDADHSPDLASGSGVIDKQADATRAGRTNRGAPCVHSDNQPNPYPNQDKHS